MTFYDSMRYVHIFAGAIALATFWINAFMRKGTSSHRTVGYGYLYAMLTILITAVPLALAAFQRGKPVTGTFLLYLLVITGSPTWQAWRAIRDKHDIRQFTGPVYRLFAWLNIASGAIVLAVGVRFNASLLIGFSMVGIVTGAFMVRFAARPPTGRTWWLTRHYAAIIACGVATHVAFLNLGLSPIVPPEWRDAALQFSFFGPLAIALVARYGLGRKYGEKKRRKPAPATLSVAPPGL